MFFTNSKWPPQIRDASVAFSDATSFKHPVRGCLKMDRQHVQQQQVQQQVRQQIHVACSKFCVSYSLVFRKKDLYLVITQKLIFMKSSGFHEIRQISCEIKRHSFPLHSIKLKSFCWVIWFIRFLGGFHEIRRISREIRRISKDQLPGMVTPMFLELVALATILAVILYLAYLCD